MSLLNTLRTAFRGFTENKLRAALTTLGVVIGVASVIAMLWPWGPAPAPPSAPSSASSAPTR